MALSSLTPSNMLGELGRLASWLKGDCLAPEEYAGLAVTEKVRLLLNSILLMLDFSRLIKILLSNTPIVKKPIISIGFRIFNKTFNRC